MLLESMRRHRLAVGIGIGIVAALAAALLAARGIILPPAPEAALPPTSEAALARALGGERWYAATIRHRPVGHYRTRIGRDGGHYVFETSLRLRLAATGGAAHLADRLLFAAEPPHRLLRAEHRSRREDGGETRIVIAGGSAEIAEGGRTRRQAWHGELTLGDYLALERALRAGSAAVGETHASRAVDFDALRVATHRWRIAAAGADGGFEVVREGGEPMAATAVHLDAQLAPVSMRSGELFALQRVADERAARAWEEAPPLFAAAARARRIPVEPPLGDPARLRRLAIGIEQMPPGGASALPVLRADRDAERPASAREQRDASRATVRYPASSPRIRELAAGAVAGRRSAAGRAEALVEFVHGHLRYRDARGARSVWDALADRSGDCTEFADLYTTLARAIGLPARTVVGLAYQADGFALHAWNEVAVDGRWRGVDPTWGRARLGATHLPLPRRAELAAMAALAAHAEPPRLRVREAVYD